MARQPDLARHRAIIAVYAAGVTRVDEIAAEFGTSRGAIGRLVNQYGVAHRFSDEARENIKRAQRRRRAGEARP